jgi:subtilisin family serine protease
MLVANRPDVGVVGLVPGATLLSARIVKGGAACGRSVLEHGLVAALGWLRRQGAQVVNVSATARRTRALVDSLRALELSGALVVASVGNGGKVAALDAFPASEPGVLGVGALAPRSSTQVWKQSTRGPQVDLVAPAEGIKVVASSGVLMTSDWTTTPSGTSFSAPLVTAAAAMVWATHRNWSAAEVANALVRSATPLGRGAPSRDWGYGRLDVRRALRMPLLADPHEPNDWVAAALAQRPLHVGAVVVASVGYAGDAVDAYAVDVPKGRSARALLRAPARGLTLRVLRLPASDAALRGAARGRRATQAALPAGRSLVVVARSGGGAGPYRLVVSGT